MLETHDHTTCVQAWMSRAFEASPRAGGLTPAFEAAFAAMWRRAHRTLGPVTLTAIVDRVLCVTSERYPTFPALKVDATGLLCGELHRSVGRLPTDQLTEGVRFVLVEFLTVLGNLTGEILTPALHAELGNATIDAPDAPDAATRSGHGSVQEGGPPTPRRADGEDIKS